MITITITKNKRSSNRPDYAIYLGSTEHQKETLVGEYAYFTGALVKAGEIRDILEAVCETAIVGNP